MNELESYLDRFQLKSFRPGQRAVIDTVFSGRDCVCIMPTGGGKSLCYQLPSIAREGLTLVVSPLIALMKDQVDALHEIDVNATFINSSLAFADQRERIFRMTQGDYDLVYIAPERLRSNHFLEAVKRANVQLLAVDEAHCISQWGHDFRPDYARLGRFRKRIGAPQTIALTATATDTVREDIVQILELEEPATFVSGFARENLSLEIRTPASNSEKDDELIEFITATDGAGIVYASTRKTCEHLVELLKDSLKRRVAFYHAGLPADERRQVQDDFMAGRVPIIVATNAFGMGIDKANLRFVVHYNLPGSLEAYYQEAGRAGRDGLPAKCLMLYSYQDKFVQEFFIENSYPSRETVKEVFEFLCTQERDPIEMTLMEIKEELGLSISTSGIGVCENLLEKAGAVERLDAQQNMASIRIDSDLTTLVDMVPRDAKVRRHVLRELEAIVGPLRRERVFFRQQELTEKLDLKWESVQRAIRELAKLEPIDYVPPFRGRAIHVLKPDTPFEQLVIDFGEIERRKKSELEKLERVIKFARSRRCRQLQILEYFGDATRTLCHNCDVCGIPQGGKPKTKRKISSQAENACLYVIQVALSGAARTHGRVGKTLLAQMLTGSTSQKLKPLHLNRLPTFGKLKALRQSDVTTILDSMISIGLLEQNEPTRFRPVIQISEFGKRVMLGEEDSEFGSLLQPNLIRTITTKFKKQAEQVHRAKSVEAPTNAAEERENEAAPRTDSKLSGNSDSPVVEEHEESAEERAPDPARESHDRGELEHDEAEGRSAVQSTDSASGRTVRVDRAEIIRASYYWTWRLLNDGYSVDDVQAIRGLDLNQVLEEFVSALENGFEGQPGWVMDAEKCEQIREFIDENPRDRLPALCRRLPESVSPQELVCYVKAAAIDRS